MSGDQIRVLHLISGLGRGGAETLLSRVVGANVSRVSQSVVSLTSAGVLGPEIAALGVNVIALDIKGPVSWLRGVAQVTALVRKERPDVVQTWLHDADLVGTVATISSRSSSLVWGLQCAELRLGDVPRRNILLVKILSRLSRRPRAVVSVSEAGRVAHIDAGYRPQRWAVIPNCVDVDRYRPDAEARRQIRKRLRVSDDTVLIGLVGRYHPMKGHELFLDAAGRLAGERPDVRFVMAGPNVNLQNPAIATQLERLGLGDRVQVVGVEPDMPAFMNALDILTVASTSEGFPTVLVEAMATGVPCAATDVGDCRLVIADTGRTASARTPEALSAAWLELVEMSSGARRDLGDRARARTIERYSTDRVAAAYLDLYAEMSRSRDEANRQRAD